ncbi:MAG: glycoside hydrolase family 130 protein [Frankiaceae bacterium]|nr:glycoside hydrolase family 130 protein [Frankiaceae bacterium]
MIEIRRASTVLHPGSTRVLGRSHVPGDDPSPDGPSRVERIVALVLQMPEPEVEAALAGVRRDFATRHRDLDLMLERNAERVDHLLAGVSPERRRLVGSYFTQEHAFESAALTNPSMVAAADQIGVAPGGRRFALSLRAIGEGHLSSITFRTGTVDAQGAVEVDDPGPLVETGERRGAVHERRHFAHKLLELGADVGCTGRVMDRLPRHFGTEDLEQALHALDDLPRAVTHESEKLARWLAASNYLLRFDSATTSLAERLIWPEGPLESRGMEDARFVRFTEDDGSTTYYATYTAYDGFTILPQLIETNDFTTFEISTLTGRGAHNKGMALFPRTIGGSYVALSRPDRENIHLVRSSDVRAWETAATLLRRPQQPWEGVQLGNCGSPIETEHGWLVLTHGVGPMRTYRLGAMLLDLEDPSRILGDLPEPILEADDDERDGYVPNVVYSCGAMRHGDHLVLPYGASDQSTRFATLSVPQLLDALLACPPAG